MTSLNTLITSNIADGSSGWGGAVNQNAEVAGAYAAGWCTGILSAGTPAPTSGVYGQFFVYDNGTFRFWRQNANSPSGVLNAQEGMYLPIQGANAVARFTNGAWVRRDFGADLAALQSGKANLAGGNNFTGNQILSSGYYLFNLPVSSTPVDGIYVSNGTNAEIRLQVADGQAIIKNNGSSKTSIVTQSVERCKIPTSGVFKFSQNGIYADPFSAGESYSFETPFDQDNIIAFAQSGTFNASNFRSVVANSATNALLFSGALYVNSSTINTVYRVLQSGNVQNANNSYGAISDAKLKQNITPAKSVLSKLRQVNWVNYELISSPELKQFGVIAQELEQLFPSLIERTADTRQVTKTRVIAASVDDKGNEIPERTEEYTESEPTGEYTLGVKYSVLYMLTAKGLQEAMDVIDAQSIQMASFEKRLAKLEAK